VPTAAALEEQERSARAGEGTTEAVRPH
jgi:hypothetical protein